MRLLAFMAPEPVPLALLLADDQAAGLLGSGVTAAIGQLLGDDVAVGDAIAKLRRYSLISPAGDGLALVHRLVQALTRAQLPVDTADQWEWAAAILVDVAIPARPQLPATWPVCAQLLPHARVVLTLTSSGMARIAWYLGASGSLATARDLFGLIADAHRDSDSYGPEHPDTLFARRARAIWTGVAGGDVPLPPLTINDANTRRPSVGSHQPSDILPQHQLHPGRLDGELTQHRIELLTPEVIAIPRMAIVTSESRTESSHTASTSRTRCGSRPRPQSAPPAQGAQSSASHSAG